MNTLNFYLFFFLHEVTTPFFLFGVQILCVILQHSLDQESYVWGPARGSAHKKSLNLHVIPKITTTYTTTTKNPYQDTTAHQTTWSKSDAGSDKQSTKEGSNDMSATPVSVSASTSRSEQNGDSLGKLQI